MILTQHIRWVCFARLTHFQMPCLVPVLLILHVATKKNVFEKVNHFVISSIKKWQMLRYFLCASWWLWLACSLGVGLWLSHAALGRVSFSSLRFDPYIRALRCHSISLDEIMFALMNRRRKKPIRPSEVKQCVLWADVPTNGTDTTSFIILGTLTDIYPREGAEAQPSQTSNYRWRCGEDLSVLSGIDTTFAASITDNHAEKQPPV